jgi:hypothetical protein
MGKGVLTECVFPRQAFRYGLGVYIHSTAGTGGENPVSGLWDRKTANLGVMSILIELVK